MAYVDDGVHLAYPEDLEQLLHHLHDELHEAGLDICTSKSCLLIDAAPAPELEQLSAVFDNTTRHDGLRIAGQIGRT
eukprot:2128997-Amphidinium_carterae.2